MLKILALKIFMLKNNPPKMYNFRPLTMLKKASELVYHGIKKRRRSIIFPPSTVTFQNRRKSKN